MTLNAYNHADIAWWIVWWERQTYQSGISHALELMLMLALRVDSRGTQASIIIVDCRSKFTRFINLQSGYGNGCISDILNFDSSWFKREYDVPLYPDLLCTKQIYHAAIRNVLMYQQPNIFIASFFQNHHHFRNLHYMCIVDTSKCFFRPE